MNALPSFPPLVAQRAAQSAVVQSRVPVGIACAASLGGAGCALALPALAGLLTSAAVGVGLGVIALGAALASAAAWKLDRRDVSGQQLLPASPDVAASADDEAPQVAAELRVLSELLAQVVSRREPHFARLPEAAAPTPMGDPMADELVRGLDKRLERSSAAALPQRDVLHIMRQSLADNRVDLYLQPTVKLPSRRPAYFEAFSRVRDENGNIIFPCDFLETAERAGLVATLDNLLLFRCITLVRGLGLQRQTRKLFINISASSLRDRVFLTEFVSYIVEHRALAPRLVFEISAQTLGLLSADVRTQLDKLARAGFAFSVDQFRTLALDVPDLASLNANFVKIDADLLIAQPLAANSLAMKLARYGIDLIATRIETEATVLEILDIGIEFGQGYLFGEPKISEAALAITAQAA